MAGGADSAYGATAAKRRLSNRLAAMRQAARLKPNEVDDMLGWKRGRLGRIERGDWAGPNPSYVRDLLRVYDPPADIQAEIMDLVQRAEGRPWWRKYAQPGDPDRIYDNEFPGFEYDASRISVYMALVIPGLLQTPPYIDALTAAGAKSQQWRERAREARLRRQQILGRTDGTVPRLIAVVTEASLLYRWGTQEQRRAQVRHLADASRRPNVELRLLRFEDGPHHGMNSQINIFDFPDDQDPSIVFLENDSTIQELAKPEDARAYAGTFARIRQAALAPPLATAHLDKLAETLE